MKDSSAQYTLMNSLSLDPAFSANRQYIISRPSIKDKSLFNSRLSVNLKVPVSKNTDQQARIRIQGVVLLSENLAILVK
jgi:hypothetical protein